MCIRDRSYIENNESAIFYKGNDLKSEKFCINQSDLSQIYMLDVTIADFNELAEQIANSDGKGCLLYTSRCV